MHRCPECLTPCHCNGDIDDLEFADGEVSCRHWQECERDWTDEDEEFDEYDDWPERTPYEF
jgi:hypothetical protein